MSRNKIALVTGSSRGIGRGIAFALAEKNWGVAIHYRQNKTAAKEVVTHIKQNGSKAAAFQADMDKIDSIREMLDAVLRHFGHIDLLVNNAGMVAPDRVDMLTVEMDSFDKVMAVNLKGPFFLTQQVANHMITGAKLDSIHRPKIINITSINSFTSSPNRAEYCISKAGLSMTTKLWADRLAEYGVKVYEICPGITQTDLTSGVKEKYDRLIFEKSLLPIQRWGQPNDVGKAVVAIAEDCFPYSTGEVIHVDGGFHLQRL